MRQLLLEEESRLGFHFAQEEIANEAIATVGRNIERQKALVKRLLSEGKPAQEALRSLIILLPCTPYWLILALEWWNGWSGAKPSYMVSIGA